MNKTITTLATKIEKEMAYERTTKKWERRMRNDKKWWKTCEEMKEMCKKMKRTWDEMRWRKIKVKRREMKRHPKP